MPLVSLLPYQNMDKAFKNVDKQEGYNHTRIKEYKVYNVQFLFK